MPPYTVCTSILLSLFLIFQSYAQNPQQANGAQAYRASDVQGYRIIIREDASDFFIEAINLDTGASYGPTQAFSELSSDLVIEHLYDPITIVQVANDSMSIQFPIYKSNIILAAAYLTDTQKQYKLLTVQIQDLTTENEALKNDLVTLQSNLTSQIEALQAQIVKPKQFFGKTNPADWKTDDNQIVYTTVDFSSLQLVNVPHVQVSLYSSDKSRWSIVGGSNFYALNNTSFQVSLGYSELRYLTNNNYYGAEYLLSDSTANSYGLYIFYTITSQDE